ncbi:MAG: hypothetical protein WCZ87_05275, partial [Thiohalobacteraceae bacterium]
MKSAQRAKLALGMYLAAVVATTLIHEPFVLGAALILAVALAGKGRWKLLRRTLFAVVAFNLTVSLGYVVVALWQVTFTPDYLVLVNLRVVLLVFLGFWFVHSIDILPALAGWPI